VELTRQSTGFLWAQEVAGELAGPEECPGRPQYSTSNGAELCSYLGDPNNLSRAASSWRTEVTCRPCPNHHQERSDVLAEAGERVRITARKSFLILPNVQGWCRQP